MLSAAGCDVPIDLLRERNHAVEAEHLRIRVHARGTQEQEVAHGRDAEVIAVLRLLSVAQRVDARRHDLAANLLERAAHANRADERAASTPLHAGPSPAIDCTHQMSSVAPQTTTFTPLDVQERGNAIAGAMIGAGGSVRRERRDFRS